MVLLNCFLKVVAVAGDIVEGAVGLDQMGRSRQLHEVVAALERYGNDVVMPSYMFMIF